MTSAAPDQSAAPLGHPDPLVQAMIAVTSELSLPAALQRIVTVATDLVDARYGALGVLNRNGTGLSEFITVGVSPEERRAIGTPPEGHGILGVLIVEPRPLRLPDLARHPDSFGFPPNHPPMQSFLGVPITLRDQVFGNLYLTDKRNDGEFSQEDEDLIVALAGSAAVAIENARLHQRLQEASLLDERERIARDLHDDVIQRLFAAGLSLQSAAQRSTQPEVTDRLTVVIDDLDVAIKQLRNSIFELGRRPGDGPSLRAELLDVCAEAARPLGFAPTITISGPLDSVVPPEVGTQVVVVLRELLANAVKHAQAATVSVSVVVDNNGINLTVSDDGVGISQLAIGNSASGLRNLLDRAEALGGLFAVVPSTVGSVVRWSVPI